ncbi:hypothetical protein DH2020_027691 [Rehmannia glutinosa]|uniref:Rad60/SUMO-like domain-containing protein n=1 Tax=Rehmannia glutinosa TaxID=99300 RepID=A0ABR0VWG0_REHGL
MAENGSKRMKLDDEQAGIVNNGVNLIIKSNEDGEEMVFVSVKRNVKIKKLLRGYCRHASLDYRSTRFVIDHRYFSHDKTPNQLGLEDDDQIDALTDGNGA